MIVRACTHANAAARRCRSHVGRGGLVWLAEPLIRAGHRNHFGWFSRPVTNCQIHLEERCSSQAFLFQRGERSEFSSARFYYLLFLSLWRPQRSAENRKKLM